jgi:hypothetical protein
LRALGRAIGEMEVRASVAQTLVVNDEADIREGLA